MCFADHVFWKMTAAAIIVAYNVGAEKAADRQALVSTPPYY
jgi:hypothetical protein